MKKLSIALLILFSLIFTACSNNLDNENSNSEIATNDADTEDNIEDIAIALFTTYETGDYEKVLNDFHYDTVMKKQLDNTLLTSAWEQLADPNGEFIEISNFDISTQGEFEIVGLVCKFSKGTIKFNVVFNENHEIAGFNFEAYEELEMSNSIKEIDYIFGKEGFELPAVLTIPEDKDTYPVVILVHGSGQHDKDETIGPNKPFQDIAWHLAEQGIGVFRYEKRTKEHSDKLIGDETFTIYDETIEDAALAYELISNEASICQDKIYILGHSLGGYVIPRIAKEVPKADGYIIMAGFVRPLEDLLVEQMEYIFSLDNEITDDEKKTIDYYIALQNTVKNLDENKDYSLTELGGIGKDYWLDLKEYNPTALAKEINQPLLILQGNRDYQVTLADYNLWKSALQAKENVSFVLYEGLNHLFIKGEGTPTPDEYSALGHVDKDVLTDITNWILQQ